MKKWLWQLYMYKPIWTVIHRCRNWWHNIKWKFVARFVVNVYEIKPDGVYAFVLSNPARGEMAALRDVLENTPPVIKAKGYLIWGSGLQIKDIKAFLEELHLIGDDGRLLLPNG
jgi:hypothetical protein